MQYVGECGDLETRYQVRYIYRNWLIILSIGFSNQYFKYHKNVRFLRYVLCIQIYHNVVLKVLKVNIFKYEYKFAFKNLSFRLKKHIL